MVRRAMLQEAVISVDLLVVLTSHSKLAKGPFQFSSSLLALLGLILLLKDSSYLRSSGHLNRELGM